MLFAHDITNGVRTEDVKIAQGISFDTLLLSSATLEGLKQSGYYKPSPIQLQGIPLGKCGFDLVLEAKSGTGKTVVFIIIALERLVLENGLQVIIMAPTREIVAQICDVIKEIGKSYTGLVVEVVMGGLSVEDDILKFKKKKKVHIVVGSPGRLRHLIQENFIDTSSVRLLVLDEADKLMEKSFQGDINYIFSKLPQQKQVIMCSATYPVATKSLIEKYMAKTQHVCPNNRNILLGVEQKITFVQYNSNIVNQTSLRYAELIKIFTKKQFKQCLIFCNYQARVMELYKMLLKDKWPAEQLYGQQEQSDRLEAIKTLREFKCRILISTDLAARGIDASNVDLVVSFEPAYEWTTYLHRIGRAGRYGSQGLAITILSLGQEVTSFRTMIDNITDSFYIYDLWTNERVNFSDGTSQKANGIENVQNEIDKSVSNIHINEKCISELWKEILYQDTNLSLNEIEDFNSLLHSFLNDVVEIKDDHFYKLIELQDLNVTILLSQLNSNTVVNTLKKMQENHTEGNRNEIKLEQTNCNSDNGFPVTQIGETEVTEKKCKTNSEKSKKKTSQITIPNNPKVATKFDNDSIDKDEYSYFSCETMAQAGLPTSFTTKHNNNNSRKNKTKIKKHKSKTDNKGSENYEEVYVPVDDADDVSHTEWQNEYKTKNKTNENKRQGYNSDTLSPSYTQWYSQLKNRTRQIEYIVYVNEMSK